jgi:hypothetical protein
MLLIRMREMKKEMLKTDSALLPLAVEYGAGAALTAELTGPARQIHIVINTQRMLQNATDKDGEFVLPESTLKKLTPYFNDCAKAAAQLDATLHGTPLDSISLTRNHILKDDYGDGRTETWRGAVQPLLTRQGAAKELTAERLVAATAAVSAVQGGTGQTLTVRPIKLKKKKP